ncbi:MAG TPA: hypothetical protein VMF69_19685 [Gemmataceae bacterium]|nr:hypothetical protein [Gemmataceae bacterium]
MSSGDRTLSFAAEDRPDYLPPPPRPATLKACAVWSRAGLLAGLVLAPPLVLYLGQISATDLRALIEQGRTTTAAIVPRG